MGLTGFEPGTSSLSGLFRGLTHTRGIGENPCGTRQNRFSLACTVSCWVSLSCARDVHAALRFLPEIQVSSRQSRVSVSWSAWISRSTYSSTPFEHEIADRDPPLDEEEGSGSVPLICSKNQGARATPAIRRTPLCPLGFRLPLVRTVGGRFSFSRRPNADCQG